MTAGMFTPRQVRSVPGGPYEGVPEHLWSQLEGWLNSVYVMPAQAYLRQLDSTALERLPALLRIPIGISGGLDQLEEVLLWVDRDEERFLEVIHYTLQLPTRITKNWKELEVLLALGGSA